MKQNPLNPRLALRQGAALAALLGALAAAQIPAAHGEDLSAWKLPPLTAPADNPQTPAKVALGHQLAFDTRLSKNDALSCAGCHVPSAGGAGLTARAFGQGGELGRWAPSWDNSAYSTALFWDGRAASLEEQTGALPGHMGPISAPGEMGGDPVAAAARLNAIPGYRKQFKAVFGSDATPRNIAQAIAAFERSLVARNSPFQRYVRGDRKALSPAAKRGFAVFQGRGMCVACHTPPLLTDNGFHNIGVPQAGPLKVDSGREAVTHDPADAGKFKTPSLYNSGAFAFYMHDGAYSTLQQVVAHYNRGGSRGPSQDPAIMPLKLSAREQADLVAFLNSLTDEGLNRVGRPALP
ncbi:MAG TPA: cytochrome c peroxidase [Gallionellaceae bacterium]|nr:cytochrome c peroxidase [Gallionellaceae bacterium]